jgi:hypothetical protein
MGRIDCPETSATKYQSPPRNVPEDRGFDMQDSVKIMYRSRNGIPEGNLLFGEPDVVGKVTLTL